MRQLLLWVLRAFAVLVILVNTSDLVRTQTGYTLGWIEKLCVCGGTLHASYWLGLDDHHSM